MPKDLRTFLEDLRREAPDEFITITKEVNPANYDVTAITKHLQNLKKFPLMLFEKPLNLNGKLNEFKLITNVFTTKSKIEIALGFPRGSRTRMELVEEILQREKTLLKPVVVSRDESPVKDIIRIGDKVDLKDLPAMKHYEMDGGPYIVMASVVKGFDGIYNVSYHRMEIKSKNLTTCHSSPRHLWKIFKDHENKKMECPVVTVISHHPAFFLGASYKGPIEVDEYDIIGGYLGEPLRLTPSELYGKDFLVPADAEIVIEGALIPGQRLTDGPFGEAAGYVGPQKYHTSLRYEIRAITHRKDPIYQSLLTPDEDKPWLELARDGGYLRRIREAVPTVTAVCKGGRHAHYNIFISMKKMSEGDPGRAAAAALTFDHSKNVFIFDDDIDVFNPTEILWAIATRVQPERDIQIIKPIMKGNIIDPSLDHHIKTSCMIVDATKPVDRPYSPVSKCPDEAMDRVKLEDYISKEVLHSLPMDRTSYWA